MQSEYECERRIQLTGKCMFTRFLFLLFTKTLKARLYFEITLVLCFTLNQHYISGQHRDRIFFRIHAHTLRWRRRKWAPKNNFECTTSGRHLTIADCLRGFYIAASVRYRLREARAFSKYANATGIRDSTMISLCASKSLRVEWTAEYGDIGSLSDYSLMHERVRSRAVSKSIPSFRQFRISSKVIFITDIELFGCCKVYFPERCDCRRKSVTGPSTVPHTNTPVTFAEQTMT